MDALLRLFGKPPTKPVPVTPGTRFERLLEARTSVADKSANLQVGLARLKADVRKLLLENLKEAAAVHVPTIKLMEHQILRCQQLLRSIDGVVLDAETAELNGVSVQVLTDGAELLKHYVTAFPLEKVEEVRDTYDDLLVQVAEIEKVAAEPTEKMRSAEAELDERELERELLDILEEGEPLPPPPAEPAAVPAPPPPSVPAAAAKREKKKVMAELLL